LIKSTLVALDGGGRHRSFACDSSSPPPSLSGLRWLAIHGIQLVCNRFQASVLGHLAFVKPAGRASPHCGTPSCGLPLRSSPGGQHRNACASSVAGFAPPIASMITARNGPSISGLRFPPRATRSAASGCQRESRIRRSLAQEAHRSARRSWPRHGIGRGWRVIETDHRAGAGHGKLI
jgi:hypothetical protein